MDLVSLGKEQLGFLVLSKNLQEVPVFLLQKVDWKEKLVLYF